MKFIKYVTNLGLIANFSPMILDIQNVDRKRLYDRLRANRVLISNDLLKSEPNYIVVDHGRLCGAKNVKELDPKFKNYFLVVLKEEPDVYCLFR